VANATDSGAADHTPSSYVMRLRFCTNYA